ncbi:MAG: sugar-binding transcriptional regulator [Chloroflexi bacterium]|nr:sugar-binding transcriptional regulator [Chloroflexota bacterium]
MGRIDELRLMTKVARMYYVLQYKQTQIAEQLDISQATISRLLKRAQDEQIVRINISIPTGIYSEIETKLAQSYGVKEVIIVDSVDDNEDQIMRDIGSAAAYYLEQTIKPNEIIGLSSWSKTLMAMVDAMNPLPKPAGAEVIQVLGGMGNPEVESHAVHLVRRLAVLVRGKAVFLPAPGVVSSAEMKHLYLQDQYVANAIDMFQKVTLCLVGIGSVEPSDMLASSGNVFSPEELDHLRKEGAVGDICMRFFDADGNPIKNEASERVIGMDLDQLRRVRRCVGVAGGKRKIAAIRGALRGGYINVLITDINTAKALIETSTNDQASLAHTGGTPPLTP